MEGKKRTLRIIVTVFMSFGLLLSSFFILFSYNNSVQSSIKRIAEESMMRNSLYVEDWMEEKISLVGNVNTSLRNLSDDRAMISYLSETLEGEPSLLDIYFVTARPPEEGGKFYSAREKEVLIEESLDGYTWYTRPWFEEARRSGTMIITDPYIDTSSERQGSTYIPLQMISISKPVYKDGLFFGVIAADILMDDLNTALRKGSLYEEVFLNLINESGFYITHEEEEKILQDSIFEDYPSIEENREAIIARSFFYDTAGRQFFSSIGVKGTDWILVQSGLVSIFYDNAAVLISMAVVLLLLMAFFLLLLIRSWRSAASLEEAKQEIDRQNRELETTVKERTQSLQNILDNTGQGFFTFGSDFLVEPQYSRGCVDILGKEIGGEKVTHILFPAKHNTAQEFVQGFELFFEGKTKAEIIIDLTEKTTVLNERIISVDYKAISDSKILCILTDISLQTQYEENNRIEKERHEKLMAAINHKHSFANFMNEAESLFSSLELYINNAPSKEELEQMQREIHTFKGNSGFFRFIETQTIAHESETTIADSMVLESPISFKEINLSLKRAFFKELKSITDTMGENWLEEANGITVPLASYNKIIQYVQKKVPQETKLLHFLVNYKKIPFREIFSRLPFAAEAAAEKLGKKIKPMKIIGGEQRVLPDRYYPLAENLIHLVNNIVDHGIEFPFERETVQKLSEGKIELYINIDKSHVSMEFKDDGKGINVKEIERTARDKGLLEEGRQYSNSELLQFIFQAGFSTKTETTTTSGRGIGMSAVYEEVSNLGGNIDVQSRLGKGTSFEISIPLKI